MYIIIIRSLMHQLDELHLMHQLDELHLIHFQNHTFCHEYVARTYYYIYNIWHT